MELNENMARPVLVASLAKLFGLAMPSPQVLSRTAGCRAGQRANSFQSTRQRTIEWPWLAAEDRELGSLLQPSWLQVLSLIRRVENATLWGVDLAEVGGPRAGARLISSQNVHIDLPEGSNYLKLRPSKKPKAKRRTRNFASRRGVPSRSGPH